MFLCRRKIELIAWILSSFLVLKTPGEYSTCFDSEFPTVSYLLMLLLYINFYYTYNISITLLLKN